MSILGKAISELRLFLFDMHQKQMEYENLIIKHQEIQDVTPVVTRNINGAVYK